MKIILNSAERSNKLQILKVLCNFQGAEQNQLGKTYAGSDVRRKKLALQDRSPPLLHKELLLLKYFLPSTEFPNKNY